jgi:hypothetical protein
LVSSFALSLSLAPSFASADEPTPTPAQQQCEKRVREGLVAPLADYEASTSRFSRARLPPRERRVRITQVTPTVDAGGRPFMAFAIDARWGTGEWHENDIVGCAYTTSGDIFVKRGDDFRPAAILLGKPADPASGVCKAAPRA